MWDESTTINRFFKTGWGREDGGEYCQWIAALCGGFLFVLYKAGRAFEGSAETGSGLCFPE